MRALATLVALLMLLTPLAAAQDDGEGSGSRTSTSGSETSTSTGPSDGPGDGSGNSTTESSSEAPKPVECPMPERRPATEEEVRACKERFCQERPQEPACRKEQEREDDAAAENESAARGPREWQRWCREESREDPERGRCRTELSRFGSGASGKWIAFEVDAANATLLGYTVAGRPVLDSLHVETGSDNLTVHAAGSSIRIGDEDTDVILHDDPTGLIRLKGEDGSLLMVFPDGADVQASEDGSVARIRYEDGRVAHLRAGNATWLDARTVLAEGFAALLVPPPDEKPGRDAEVQGEVTEAIERRKVGAEVTLRAKPQGAGAAAADAAPAVEVLEYDDLQVDVRMPSGPVATPEAPIRVEISADLDEGRTIVLNVNRSLLEAADPKALVLRYFDLHEQADGSVLETEVVFAQAASLQDVLDPTDDSGQPEYWVVEDSNGLQVLASIPHWSAHAITIGSIALLAVSPNVVLGLVAGVAGSVVAAVAMLWPRRRIDE